EAPVYRHDDLGFFALSRFDDIQSARLDPDTFSSRGGVLFEQMLVPHPPLMLIEMDRPEHTAMRRVANRNFTPRAIEELAATIGNLCTELLDRLADAGSFDFVADFAKPLPMMVTSSLLDLDRPDLDEVVPLFEAHEDAVACERPDMAVIVRYENDIRAVLAGVIDDRLGVRLPGRASLRRPRPVRRDPGGGDQHGVRLGRPRLPGGSAGPAGGAARPASAPRPVRRLAGRRGVGHHADHHQPPRVQSPDDGRRLSAPPATGIDHAAAATRASGDLSGQNLPAV